MRRKLLIAVCLVIAAVAGLAWFNLRAAKEAFQHDADIARLRQLDHYGTLIEDVPTKNGKGPASKHNAVVPIYVHVANDQQIAYTTNGPPTPHQVVSMTEFVSELETGLGRTIDEYYDPQYRPVNKPNFYIYMVRDDSYFFADHVHQPFPFAKKIADHYYKIETSNVADESNGACDPDLLFAATEFTSERDKHILKRLFRLRDEKYLHFTKQK